MQLSASRIHAKCPCAPAKRISVVRAQQRDHLEHTAQGAIAACCTAACLLLAGPAFAEDKPVSPAEAAYDREALVLEQKSMLEFMLQQRENAEKASIIQKRQQLQAELGKVEAALQARLNQQKANMIGAEKIGDARAIESASQATAQLEEKQQQILKAAAQFSSQLDRMELLEKARSVAAKQSLEKAVSEVDSAVNANLNPWLESMAKLRK